jgi:hypothetical protein
MVLILLSPLLLLAEHHWELEISKSELVVGEATLLSYTCYFDSEAYGTSIHMNTPASNDDYRIEHYKEREKIINDQRQNLFQYVIFPKRSGVIDVVLSAQMRKTTRQQVENAVIGRDNVENYQFEKQEDILPLTRLHVKPTSAKLVGDFSLHVSIDKDELSSFEPLHVSISFEGVGNLDQYQPVAFDVKGADVFREEPEQKYRLTPEGFKGTVTQKFALLSDRNFTLPSFALEVYNPKLGKTERLSFERKTLHVKPAYTKKELLDPPSDEEGFSWQWSWLYYLFTLVLGVLLGWYLHQFWNRPKTKAKDFMQAKDAKTLLTHLALQGGHEKLIEQAQNEQWSFKQIQNALED